MPGFEIIGEEERQAVNEVFDNGACLFRYGFDFMRNDTYKVIEFEKEFAQKMNMKYAHATTSGTSALFVVNKRLGIGAGDEVITQAFTFVATVEAIAETGATPVITEIDSTLNMDPDDLERKITDKTKAIWVVHMMGGPARMKEILAIGAKHGIPVLEDTAQGIGAMYDGKPCGVYGHANIFSFDFGKTMTTGEGGMILTEDEELYLKIKAYTDHGHEDNPEYSRGEDTASFSGFNFRMMELQGAIGLAQLKKLPSALKKIKENYNAFRNQLGDLKEIEFRETPENSIDAGDSLIFFLKTKEKRIKVSDYLASQGIGFKLLPGAVKWHFAGRWSHIWDSIPAYKGKDYLQMWPASHDLLERSIALPVMINMDKDKIDFIAESVKKAVKLL